MEDMDRILPKKPRKQERCRRSQRGLSLIELIVVIVIMGVLGTVILINVLPAADQSRVQTAKTNILTLETALDQYRLDMGAYPTSEQGLQALRELPPGLANSANYRPGGYIRKLPKDPWGNDYVYIYPDRDGSFTLLSYGADGREGGEGLNADISSRDQG